MDDYVFVPDRPGAPRAGLFHADAGLRVAFGFLNRPHRFLFELARGKPKIQIIFHFYIKIV